MSDIRIVAVLGMLVCLLVGRVADLLDEYDTDAFHSLSSNTSRFTVPSRPE